MHPNIYEIVSKIKTECPETYVAFTSNGTLLNERNIGRLIDSKLDMVSFSLDGPKLERGRPKG
ncbi:MAG: radical SAM protein [Bacteriovoracaceae bacterium]